MIIRAGRLLACAIFCCSLAPTVLAEEAPDAMVRRVTAAVLQVLSQQAADGPIDAPTRARIETVVEPVFDLERMTAIAVGAAWRQATEAQRKRLQLEYRALLLRAYSATITRSKLPEVEFKPLVAAPEDTRVVVRTVVKPAASAPVPVDYRISRTPDGWKVYDVVTDGISLAVTYRNVFAQEAAAHGIEGLIDMIANKNRDEQGKNGSDSGA